MVATTPELTSPLIDSTTNSTAYAVTTDLEYGQTYYWAVKSLEPVEGNWSTIANFTVMPLPVEPAPPVVVQEVPPPVISIASSPASPEIVVLPPLPPEQVIPPYIWAIIIIGTMLIILVIILIFRTRRPV
jgi:hypothetical protein